jgi:Raf kinase inhibitor-like YbhB/YbcL family protein
MEDDMPARTIKKKSAPLTMNAVEGSSAPSVTVASPAFENGGEIPHANTDYGDGFSPALTWDNVPAGTRSFAVVLEDPDVRQNPPFVHWLLYNLPGDTRELPESIAPDSPLTEFAGARQGRTSNGTIGYFGPRPPTQDKPHHYHFEVFCLDSYLDIDSGADREQLIKAMAGHVLAKGELVGLYEAAVS